MARLGDLLVAAELVSADNVEQALRAQVVWGGRLGTNLIELGAIDLDSLSRILGQQHDVPGALERHFDKADPELQAQLPASLAKKFCVVPLVRLSPERVAVVALDPLRRDALEALASVYTVDPREGIIYSVAAEMRVLYHLERVYKIARSTRYLRARGATVPAFPQFDDVAAEIDTESSETNLAGSAVTESPPASRLAEVGDQGGNADDFAALIDLAIENVVTPMAEGEPVGRDRRTYVRTLGDDVEQAEAKAERLGRIAIKRVAVVAGAPTVEVIVEDAAAATPRDAGPASLTDATRAIKRGPNRDRVAELVVEALEQFVPACQAALLLVIRGDVAIGWKHFARSRDGTPEIAVPLDQPGVVPLAIAQQQLARGAAEDLGPIDRLLMRELGVTEGELVVAPILIGRRVMCLLAAATEYGADASPVDAVASAAGAAFARLIRDASR